MNVCFIIQDFNGISQNERDFVFLLQKEFQKNSWNTTISILNKNFKKIQKNKNIDIIEVEERFLGEKIKRESYSTYQYLKRKKFNLVLILFSPSIGYYPALAKSQGLLEQEVIISSILPNVSPDLEGIEHFKNIFEILMSNFMESQFHKICDFVLYGKNKKSSEIQVGNKSKHIESDLNLNSETQNEKRIFEKFCKDIIERFNLSTKNIQKNTKESTNPLVSVCVVNHNRHFYLSELLKCFENQTYKNFEIILIDDGSTDKGTIKYLSDLEDSFRSKNWKIIRQQNKYLGAARNEAVRNASGEYIVFADDDNYPQPHELEVFVGVMQKTGADILTSGMEVFFGKDVTKRPKRGEFLGLPLGPCIGLGFLENVFGDANCCIKKSAFQRIGGFTEDYGIGYEDWEFFARAALRGFNLQVVPESLFFYRMHRNSMSKNTSFLENRKRSLRPYLEQTDPATAEILKTISTIYNFQNYRHIFSTRNRYWFILLKVLKERGKLRKFRYFFKILRKEGLDQSLKIFSIYLSQ